MTALSIARWLEKNRPGEKVLMLERGTWWTTPVSTLKDKEVATYRFLRDKRQPVQFWSTSDHVKGFIDIFLRCVRRKKNEDGLYELSGFGTRGLFGVSSTDGLAILRASGVGGGSLIYSNITIQPPDCILDQANAGWSAIRWTPPAGVPGQDVKAGRDYYYALARQAIGGGVLSALDRRDGATGTAAINQGLHKIVVQTAGMDPHFAPGDRITPPTTVPPEPNALWLNRGRVFQTAMAQASPGIDFGSVDLAINGIKTARCDPANPSVPPLDPGTPPANYCERQGRCNVGCRPGARYTLNKQLMPAALGTPDTSSGAAKAPSLSNLEIHTLCEVDVVAELENGYEIRYHQRDPRKPWRTVARTVTADRVILAAGCVGSTEILLRSRARGTLRDLSDQVGHGFSTNGDYIGFLDETKQWVGLTRGPVTTSFAHFVDPKPGSGPDPMMFHTVEDQGIPPALSVIVGHGIPLLRRLSTGKKPRWAFFLALGRWSLRELGRYVRAYFQDADVRQDVFTSEEESTARMMCVVGMGRDASDGVFRLGTGAGETSLRIRTASGRPFHEDPIFERIRRSFAELALRVRAKPHGEFVNPFLSSAAKQIGQKAIVVTHPLGGCRTGDGPANAVVNERGSVFRKSGGVYQGLYVADASIVPTGLGVNPSLTITALALYVADGIIAEMKASARS